MNAWSQCLSSLRLKAFVKEFIQVPQFFCTILGQSNLWCGDESRISYSSFSPKGGVKYKVFDTTSPPLFKLHFNFIMLCTVACLVACCWFDAHVKHVINRSHLGYKRLRGDSTELRARVRKSSPQSVDPCLTCTSIGHCRLESKLIRVRA